MATATRKPARARTIITKDIVLSFLNTLPFSLFSILIFTFLVLICQNLIMRFANNLNSAEASVSSAVFLNGTVEVLGLVVRPEYIINVNFGISRLPEKVV